MGVRAMAAAATTTRQTRCRGGRALRERRRLPLRGPLGGLERLLQSINLTTQALGLPLQPIALALRRITLALRRITLATNPGHVATEIVPRRLVRWRLIGALTHATRYARIARLVQEETR